MLYYVSGGNNLNKTCVPEESISIFQTINLGFNHPSAMAVMMY